MKSIAKVTILIVTLIGIVFASGCGCANVVTRDIPRVIQLTSDFSDILLGASDAEDAIENAKQMLHPDSPISEDYILSEFKENEKIAELGEISASDIQLGDFSSPKIKLEDEELGGNVYEVTTELTVKGVKFDIVIRLLGDDAALGIYDFEIK